MKPEEFDRRLNQKLDELHPNFEEKDWIRFYAKYQNDLNQSSNAASRKKYLLLLLLLLLSSGIVYQSNAWTWFKNYMGTAQTAKPAILAQSQIHLNQDKSINNHSENSGFSNTNNSNKASSVETEVSDTRSQENSTKESGKTNLAQLHTENSSVIKDRKYSSVLRNPAAKTSNGSGMNETSSNQLDLNPIENKLANTDIAFKLQNEVAISEENPLNASGSELRQLTASESLPPIELSPLSIDAKHPLKTKWMSAIHAFKYSLGLTALATQKHFNEGLAFELKTKKYISFSTGLVRQSYFQQNFEDTYTFSETTANEFSDLIKPRHSRSEDIRNISITATEYLLPLQLKYYLPFNSKYAAYVAGGIQLTLSSRVKMAFDYLSYTTQQEEMETDFNQASNRSTLINQFNIGLGVQRSFKKINFQMGCLLQKNNSNQSFINKYEPALNLGVYYKI